MPNALNSSPDKHCHDKFTGPPWLKPDAGSESRPFAELSRQALSMAITPRLVDFPLHHWSGYESPFISDRKEEDVGFVPLMAPSPSESDVRGPQLVARPNSS